MFIVKVPEELIEGFPLFMERRHIDLAALRVAFEANNLEEIFNIGHKMKGTGAVYGFSEITKIGGLLEKHSSQKENNALKDTINRLEYAINNYTKEIV